jgi:hypothetical protein
MTFMVLFYSNCSFRKDEFSHTIKDRGDFMKRLAAVLILLLPTFVWAEDDNSFVSYDNIVNELKESAKEPQVQVVTPRDDFGWEEVAIHGGLGIGASYASVTSPSGIRGSGLMTGWAANFGINLFSRYWRAEGAFNSFSQSSLAADLKAELKEFELRAVYLPPLEDNMVLRLGAGIAARYMSLNAQGDGHWETFQATTPSTVFLLGFERKITKSLSLGPDISYRAALVSDTFDKSGWDASFRLNASF